MVHDDRDNHASLAAIRWQVHLYGEASAQLRAACMALGLPLHSFSWSPAHQAAGIGRGALYLLRPDSYVALADPAAADAAVLARYFSERGLRPPASP